MTSVKVARVLVGMDFDEASAAALTTAAALAKAWGAELTIFHAVTEEVPAYFTAAQIDEIEAEREQGQAAAAGQVREFAGPHASGAAKVIVGTGPAQDAIVRLAPEFDVIVLGTHRRHGLPRWWLGSVAEAVVGRSPRPVLVVPAGAVMGDRPTILAAGADPAAEAWAGALSGVVGGSVVRAEDIGRDAAERADQADVIVFPVPAALTRARLGELARLLKECRHPVLFVPSEDTPERASS